MTSIRDFKNTLSSKSSTPSQHKRQIAKYQMERWFKNHPSYFQMKYDKDNLVYDVILEDKKSLNSVTSWRNLYSFKFMNLGDYFSIENEDIFKNKIWMVTKKDPYNGVYFRYDVRECNENLTFYNDAGKLIQKPCIYESKNPYNPGEKEYPQIILGANQRAIIVPNDSDTKVIRRNFDFVFDDLAYKVTSYDSRTEPELLYLILTEYQKNSDSKDDVPVIKHTYRIELAYSQVGFTLNETIDLKPLVWEDDSIIVQRDLIYASNNESVVKIENNKPIPISNGVSDITIRLKDNSNVSATTRVTINNIASEDIRYSFDKFSPIIPLGFSKSYSFYKYNKNVKLSDTFTFSIDYSGLDLSICSLEVIDGNNFKLIANKKTSGTIRIIARDSSNAIVSNKDITIKYV